MPIAGASGPGRAVAAASAVDPAARPPKLLAAVRAAVRLRHYSSRTETAYVAWVRRFVVASGRRHPADLGVPAVTAFLSSLASEGQVSASTQNQALAAILFLYREVLHAPIGHLDGIVRARRPHRLPVVLSRDEVRAVLARLTGPHQLVASLLYGSGLRLMEALRLRVHDLDHGHGEILVRGGKGDRDRVTVLAASIHDPLAAHLQRVRVGHDRDLARGAGHVALPGALARKYPSATSEWGWP